MRLTNSTCLCLLRNIFSLDILILCRNNFWRITLRMCTYSEYFWSLFPNIRTKYGDLLCKSLNSEEIRENADQKNSEQGHFQRSLTSMDPLMSSLLLILSDDLLTGLHCLILIIKSNITVKLEKQYYYIYCFLLRSQNVNKTSFTGQADLLPTFKMLSCFHLVSDQFLHEQILLDVKQLFVKVGFL